MGEGKIVFSIYVLPFQVILSVFAEEKKTKTKNREESPNFSTPQILLFCETKPQNSRAEERYRNNTIIRRHYVLPATPTTAHTLLGYFPR